MSEQYKVNLNYLNEDEVLKLYELFFGAILIKKNKSHYLNNLNVSLKNENFVKRVIGKLNRLEVGILRILSQFKIVPYAFINEKLSLILDEQTSIIGKFLLNLIANHYIFIRDDEFLVIPDIYFSDQVPEQFHYQPAANPGQDYHSPLITTINNLINYLITQELTFSKKFTLYKKDLDLIAEIFNIYSELSKEDYQVIAYFFNQSFYQDEQLIINLLKNYYQLSSLERFFEFLKFSLPCVHNILNYFYEKKISAAFDWHEFEKVWIRSLLLTPYENVPLKIQFPAIVSLLIKAKIIEQTAEDQIIIRYYSKSQELKEQVNINANYYLYINSDSTRQDFYFPSLFADFVKYNQITEYEITEKSIIRAINHGLNYSDIENFLNEFNINLANHVQATIMQWFDKNGSYYYVTGTLFFCESIEKGKIISKLIQNEMLQAQIVKKDQFFLIPDNQAANFFSFLEKSGINYYYKNTQKNIQSKKYQSDIDLSSFFNQ